MEIVYNKESKENEANTFKHPELLEKEVGSDDLNL